MAESAAPAPEVTRFVTRWRASGAAERANYQLFLSELCDVLQVPRPDPALPDEAGNAYVFEKTVRFANPDGTESLGRIDLYRRGCFVLEAKQGSDRSLSPLVGEGRGGGARRGTAVRGTGAWDAAMIAARGQAEQYAKALPSDEGWPPFLVVVDVGHVIELFSDFTGTGKRYLPFPDARTFRLRLADLERDDVRARLRAVWLDPSSLDPARASARVTREVAERLAALARSLEEAGHAPHDVASFLMRCVFTMFAEDVDLLPAGSFTRLLEEAREQPDLFPLIAESLWESMKTGGFAPILKQKVLRFNGNLFAERGALPLTAGQLRLLHEAARADWKSVEPAIFGTLLERALDPAERHRLGAHYTPRAYVERLVVPTLVDPLREEWEAAQAAAVTLANQGRLKEARDEVRAFHRRLCAVRVLDPACGSGNFLYVALEHLKRLEGEVLNALHELGEGQMGLELAGLTVDPHQLLGIEVNPRAAAIADVVLWIGYLQWHFRTRGRVMPPRAGAPGLPQHRVPRRRVGVGPHRARAGRSGQPRHPLGRRDHEAPPRHRPARARRNRPGARGALREPQEGAVAGNGLRGGEPAVHREQADAAGARRRVRGGAAGGAPGRARDRGPGDVLVARGGRTCTRGVGPPIRLRHDEQHHTELQQRRRRETPGARVAGVCGPRSSLG
jgi:hypothetical protein